MKKLCAHSVGIPGSFRLWQLACLLAGLLCTGCGTDLDVPAETESTHQSLVSSGGDPLAGLAFEEVTPAKASSDSTSPVAVSMPGKAAVGTPETNWQSRLFELRFVCYFPSTGRPDEKIAATTDAMKADLKLLRRAGFNGIITYSCMEPYGNTLVELAAAAGMEGMLVGVWDPKDPHELNSARSCAANPIVLGYVVGNEGLGENKRYTFSELASAIHDLEETTGKPCAFTEEIDDYYGDPRLLELGSFHAVNAHPFFHSRLDPKAAVEWTVEAYRDFTQRTQKPVLFKEVGLPTAGDQRAQLSESDQDIYYAELAATETHFAYFEAFDLKWKDHLPVEPHWGIFRNDRTPKLFGQRLLGARPMEVAASENPQPAQPADPKQSQGKPAILQVDGTFSVDRFYVPSGITGDIGDVKINWGDGGTTQFIYSPQGSGRHEWEHKRLNGELNAMPAQQAGVIWLSPANDFGSTPKCGYNLESMSPTTITWEARSMADPVWVSFFCGGTAWKWDERPTGSQQVAVDYPDSAPYQSLGCHKLDKEWQTFRCQLPAGRDYSRVVAGFGWNMSWAANGIAKAMPNRELQFEVRRIRYESEPATAISDPDVLPVYTDADSARNAFFAGGLMGDTGDVTTISNCEDNPHAGRTCTKVVYTAKGTGPHGCDYAGPCRWAGGMWQYPASNWGKHAFWKGLGYDLSPYRFLVFWARADQDCEIEFMLGGASERYGDSLKFPQKRVVQLTRTWTQYAIPLEGDRSHIITGFGWATSQDQNADGVTFYLDDVQYVKDYDPNAHAGTAKLKDGRSPHEKLTADAWAAFNAEDYKEAIALADKCVKQFRADANIMQKALIKRKVELPAGRVTDEEKEAIFANGLLNDTATCEFIIGRSAELMGDIAMAKRHYQSVLELTEARCWDPQGFFWIPSTSAQGRLMLLELPVP